jgi:hypothetical protein
MAAASALTDHDAIRRWAEERNAKPACVKGAGNGRRPVIRLDLPGYSGEDSLEAMSWDSWFEAFEESELALLVQERTKDSEPSNFNELVGRASVAG